MEHAIKLDIRTQPIQMHPYRHPKMIQYDIEEAIKILLEFDIIRPSSIPYASLVVIVKKKGGTLRICIEFRTLNKKIVKNRYPIPRIYELMDALC